MTSGAVVQYNGGVSNNWDNYQNQIHKYLKLIENNPFVNELENDFKESNILNITKYLLSHIQSIRVINKTLTIMLVQLINIEIKYKIIIY